MAIQKLGKILELPFKLIDIIVHFLLDLLSEPRPPIRKPATKLEKLYLDQVLYLEFQRRTRELEHQIEIRALNRKIKEYERLIEKLRRRPPQL